MNLKSRILLGLLLAGLIFACPTAKADTKYGAISPDLSAPKTLPNEVQFETLPGVPQKINSSAPKGLGTNGISNYQTEKLKNAVTNIDGAQIDLRAQLTVYKKNLDEIESRFKAVKNERKAEKSKIKKAEKRLKQMEAAKKKIGENIN